MITVRDLPILFCFVYLLSRLGTSSDIVVAGLYHFVNILQNKIPCLGVQIYVMEQLISFFFFILKDIFKLFGDLVVGGR